MPNRRLQESEEVLEALEEISHQTVGGIEVIEYEHNGSEPHRDAADQAIPTASDQFTSVQTGARLGGESVRIRLLEQKHARIVAQFDRARQQWHEREQAYQTRIETLSTNFRAVEQELVKKSTELQSLMAEYEKVSRQVAREDDATCGITVGFVEPHTKRESTADILKARIEERGRALNVLREEVTALRADNQRLTEALTDRGQQIARLMDHLTHLEVSQGFGVTFRSGLRRLFQKEPAIATRADRDTEWHPQTVEETTVVLTSSSHGSECEGRVPVSLTANASRTATGDCKVGRSVRKRTGTAMQLRRFLLPVDPDSPLVLELSGARSYVGRDVEADLRIPDATISRLHGVLYCIGGATIVEDARSTNGTYVNRHRVANSVLRDGDLVAFGNIEFTFRIATSNF